MPVLSVAYDAHAEIIDKNLVSIVTGSAAFRERDDGGRCLAEFRLRQEHVSIRPTNGSHQVSWCAEKKCADGCLIGSTDQGIALHIVELKSTLTFKQYKHVRSQFAGMFASAIALSRLLSLGDLISIICYIVYTENRIDFSQTASLVNLKPMAKGPDVQAVADWKSGKITLPLGNKADLMMVHRLPDVEHVFCGTV